MSEAYKCDKCGKLFEEAPKPIYVDTVRGIKQYVYIDSRNGYTLNYCPACTRSLLNKALEQGT